MNCLNIPQVQSLGLQSFIFCYKIFELSSFFNSAGKVIPEDCSDCSNSLKIKFAGSYVSSIHGDTRP